MLRSPVLLGALCLVLAECCFAGLAALVKSLSDELSQSQLVFFRNAFALLAMLPWLLRTGRKGVYTRVLPLHILRGVLGVIAMYCFFLVIANLPLADAMMALLMAPFFAPIIGRLWLKEGISYFSVGAIVLGFAGCAFILRPTGDGNGYYMLVALGCALLVAVNKCAIRKMTHSEPSMRIVFYFAVIATLLTALPLPFHWQDISLYAWLQLTAIGVTAALGQWLMTQAFAYASPNQIGLLSYSSVIFAALIGWLVWQEAIQSGLVVGSLLIFFAANMAIRQRWL